MQNLNELSDRKLLDEYSHHMEMFGQKTKWKIELETYYNEIFRRMSSGLRWLPISEAPKDGTKIFSLSSDWDIPRFIYWGEHYEYCDGLPLKKSHGWCFVDGDLYFGPVGMTHFIIPLPSPTEKKDAE